MIAAWRPSDAHEPVIGEKLFAYLTHDSATEPISSPWMDRMLLDALRGIGEDTSIGSPWMTSLIDLRSDPPWEYPRAPTDDRVELSAYTIENGFFGAPERETWKYDRVQPEDIVDALAYSYGWYASPPDEPDVADAVRDQMRGWQDEHRRWQRDRREYVYDSLLAPFSQHKVTMAQNPFKYVPCPDARDHDQRYFVGESRLWFSRDIPRIHREPAFTVLPYYPYYPVTCSYTTTAQDLHQKNTMTNQPKTTASNPFPEPIITAVRALAQTSCAHGIANDMVTANMNPAFIISTTTKVVELRDALKTILAYEPPPPAPVLTSAEEHMVESMLRDSRAHRIALVRGAFPIQNMWIVPRELSHSEATRFVRHEEFARRYCVSIHFARGVDQGFTGDISSGVRVGEAFESGVRVGAAVWSRRAEGYQP